MYKINRNIVVIFFLLISGCSSSIPIYKREYSEGFIREELIARYYPENGEMQIELEITDAELLIAELEYSLPSIIEIFKNTDLYAQGDSKISKLTIDESIEHIRIEMKNCRYFEVEIDELEVSVMLRDSGVMAPCNR